MSAYIPGHLSSSLFVITSSSQAVKLSFVIIALNRSFSCLPYAGHMV